MQKKKNRKFWTWRYSFLIDRIDDAYHRAIKSHHNRNVSRDPIQNVLTLPFHRPFLPLVNIFKHHFNITIVFHYNSTTKNILINNNHNKPEA